MNRRIRLVTAMAATVLTAGCGSTARTAAPATTARPPSLGTSLATATGTWAVAVMGGSAASHNNFWQLFVRPAGTTTWQLATPPGVASNGGLVLTGLSAGSVLAGFRPSQDLSYSPLASTRDNGTSWSRGLLDAALADVPGALAADPASGRRLALLANGTTDISGPSGTAWTPLVSRRALAATPADTRCHLVSLTAVTFGPSGQAMLGAGCGRPGTAGIFSHTGGTWQLTGPTLPAAHDHQAISVLRLTTSAGTTTALLAEGTGPAAHLIAAWSTDSGADWKLSPALALKGATLTSASPGPDSSLAITLSSRRAAVITTAAGSWQPLPGLPTGTATLAPSPSGGWDALAAHGTQLTIWQTAPGAQTWARRQSIKVPVQFGSSG